MVNRCVCRNVSLSVVAEAAADMRSRGMPVTLEALSLATGAGTGCGMCAPYLARSAMTGEAAVPVMKWDQGESWMTKLSSSGERPAARSLS